MKKLHLKNNFDLSICTSTQQLKIRLIQRLAQIISKKQTTTKSAATPRWRDFFYIFLMHHFFTLFQATNKFKRLLSRLTPRAAIDRYKKHKLRK